MLNLLRHTAEVRRLIDGQTDFGTPTKTFAAVGDIPCLIQIKSVSALDMYGKITHQQSPVMYCQQEVQVTDRIKHGDDLYRVVGIVDGGGQGHHHEVQLESIEHES